MSVWLREVIGWVLLGVGLAAFAVCYFVFLLQRRVIEAAGLGMIGFVVFRGGMRLLTVAMAARAGKDASKVAVPQKKAAPSIRLPGAGANPGRPTASVVPGTDARR